MRRIPDGKNPDGVYDNLLGVTGGRSVRANGRADAQLFGIVPDPTAATDASTGMRALLIEEVAKKQMVPPHESAYFVERALVFYTSCDERRYRPVGVRAVVGLHRRREPLRPSTRRSSPRA